MEIPVKAKRTLAVLEELTCMRLRLFKKISELVFNREDMIALHLFALMQEESRVADPKCS
jgi:hypothetical protein